MRIKLEEAVSHKKLKAVISGVLRRHKYKPHWEHVFSGGRKRRGLVYIMPRLEYTSVYVPGIFGKKKIDFRIPAVDGKFEDVDYLDYHGYAVSDSVLIEVERKLKDGKTE